MRPGMISVVKTNLLSPKKRDNSFFMIVITLFINPTYLFFIDFKEAVLQRLLAADGIQRVTENHFSVDHDANSVTDLFDQTLREAPF